MKHFNIKISGRVQGVFFRVSCKDKAEELGIKGFVRNEPGGYVYIEAEGSEADLKKFVGWCNEGTASTKVDKVEVEEGDLKGFDNFNIDYS